MAPLTHFLSGAALIFGLTIAAPTLQERQNTNTTTHDCNGATYDPASYTCFYGTLLCPIINGEYTVGCGSACYSEQMYSCSPSNVLSILPAVSGPFTLRASNPSAPFDGQTIEACSQRFFIGQGPCTYCPSVVNSTGLCNNFDHNTTMYSGALATIVPGGQQTYWQTSGALAFTQAHSAATYNASGYGSAAYAGAGVGGYFGPNNEGLVACPYASDATTGVTTVWQVFARLAGLEEALKGCTGFYALVKPEASGTYGAWQYT